MWTRTSCVLLEIRSTLVLETLTSFTFGLLSCGILRGRCHSQEICQEAQDWTGGQLNIIILYTVRHIWSRRLCSFRHFILRQNYGCTTWTKYPCWQQGLMAPQSTGRWNQLWPDHFRRTYLGVELELAGRHPFSAACNPQELQQLCETGTAHPSALFVGSYEEKREQTKVLCGSAQYFQLVQVQASMAATLKLNCVFNQLYISFICDQGAFKHVWGIWFCWGIYLVLVTWFVNCRLRCSSSSGCGSPRQKALITEGMKMCVPARWMDPGKYRAGEGKKSKTMASLDCEGIRAQGFFWDFSSEEPAQAISVLLQLYGMACLRLFLGKPGIKLVRKPGLTVWVGRPVGTHLVTGATTVRGLWSQQWKSVILGVWQSGSPVNVHNGHTGHTGKFP